METKTIEQCKDEVARINTAGSCNTWAEKKERFRISEVDINDAIELYASQQSEIEYTDEQINDLLKKLDIPARELNPSEYGLPYTTHKKLFHSIVKNWLSSITLDSNDRQESVEFNKEFLNWAKNNQWYRCLKNAMGEEGFYWRNGTSVLSDKFRTTIELYNIFKSQTNNQNK